MEKKSNKKTIQQILLIVFGAIIGIAIMYAVGGSIKSKDVYSKIINDNFARDGKAINVDTAKKISDLVEIELEKDGIKQKVYMNGEGTMFFPQVINFGFYKTAISPVDTTKDHMIGNKKAKVFIVEYSDTQCPYCKMYNDGLGKQLREKYKDSKDVAFVFRPFPLDMHPTAKQELTATECAGTLGGDEKYFEFKDKIFAITESNNRNAKEVVAKLPVFAKELGLSSDDFKACVDGKEALAKVDASIQDGLKGGVSGTPSIFVYVKKDGVTYKTDDLSADTLESFIDGKIK